MPRRLPSGDGFVFHVMNRGARRLRLFDQPADYGAFLVCMSQTLDKVPLQLLAYCIMPNHFHLVVRPTRDGELGRFMKHLTGTHGKRWHAYRGTVGTGCVYQGRYKAIAVQQDRHLLTVCRYVERNPVRAGLVRRAEAWPWSSAGQRFKNCNVPPLDPWPILPPTAWLEMLNEPEPEAELGVIRGSIARNRPLGSPTWRKSVPAAGPRGRPKKDVGCLFT